MKAILIVRVGSKCYGCCVKTKARTKSKEEVTKELEREYGKGNIVLLRIRE